MVFIMKNLKAIKNAQIVLKNGIIWEGIIIVQDDRIVSLGNKRDIDIPIDAQIIDAKGAYVGPGFIDIHVHGDGGQQRSELPVHHSPDSQRMPVPTGSPAAGILSIPGSADMRRSGRCTQVLLHC